MQTNSFNKICHCSVLHNLDDSRILHKECISLAKAGYDITFIAKPATNYLFEKDSYQGVKLQALTRNNRLFNNLFLFWTILNQKMKVVHFHDPELIIVGLFLKLLGKNVIYDVHENVRQDIFHKKWISPSLRFVLSKFFVFLEFMANICFDGIVTATPVIAENFNNNNTTVIRNLPPLKKQEVLVEVKRKKNIIIYIGSLSEARGINELILAAEYLTGEAELWLLGGWIDQSFKLKCEMMVGFKNTRYLGIVSHEEVSKILNEASIGLCTLHPIDTFKDSYPIKVFEYMQNGLPVLMSNFEMWYELFGNLCNYTDPLNPLVMAKQIKDMLDNPARLQEMSAKGKLIINEQYNWDTESKILEGLYSKI